MVGGGFEAQDLLDYKLIFNNSLTEMFLINVLC